MKVIISGGGTAGHINPAIAIADKLREKDDNCEILFVGSKNGMENRLVPLASYPIWSIDCAGLKRKLSVSNIKVFFKNQKAQKQARKLISDFCPDAVIGTGGYVCYPIVKAACKMGVYTALHESNAVPGLAVRALKNSVNRIFVSFKSSAQTLNRVGKCMYTGNPVKSEISGISREEARKALGVTGKYRYVIVSFGGSLGAETINNIALDIMERMTAARGDVLHIHSCGRQGAGGFFERFNERQLGKCKNIRASEYIYDMPMCLKAADIVICRSGAMTLSEIAQASVASVLVPSPNVTGNHQYKNAIQFLRSNAAFVVDEKDGNAIEQAYSYVKKLLEDRALREQMSVNARLFAHPDAADKIVERILDDVNSMQLSAAK